MSEQRAEIVRQFCAVLEKEEWEPVESAIEKIVDTSLKNKEHLREMLSRHPKWNSNTMRITMPIEPNGERIDVPEKMDGFRLLCEEVDTDPLNVFENVLTRGGALTPDDCEALQAKGYNGGKTGQKIGRAINAWATTHSVDKHKDYNWRFNELINGGRNTTDRVAVLSINPVDYLTASHGDFDSCHNIHRVDNCCYKSGNLSYAMDKVTMVFFTVGAGELPDYPTWRIDRINYHFDSGLLIQGRLYTATRENIHAISRAMICKVIAECLDVPNLWTKHIRVDQERIVTIGNHYPDYERNPSACTMSTLIGMTLPDSITIGHIAYCICCGGEQYESKILDCCDEDNEDDMRTCESCGNEIHADDAIWVSDNCYCSDCTSYCEHCQRYYYKDNVQWIDSVKSSICDRCLEEDFTECVACDKTVKKDDAHEADDGSYCTKCFNERFSNCTECDEAFGNEELTEVAGRLLCRDCLGATLTEQASSELVCAL